MHIDFLGPLTQTLNGNSYVGLAVCALTKYVEAAGKIANTKLTLFNKIIPLRCKPTTTPPPKFFTQTVVQDHLDKFCTKNK